MTSSVKTNTGSKDSSTHLVVALVRRRSFTTGDADAQAASLPLNGQGVLQVRSASQHTASEGGPRMQHK